MTETVTMTKGDIVSLAKAAPTLTNLFVGAGWDAKKGGATMDLDLAAFMLDGHNRLPGKGYFVYYNNQKSACGSVASRGDNLTGDESENVGDDKGDDEVIDVNLTTIPKGISQILFVASIYQGKRKGQSLKDLDNAFIRIVNNTDQKELANYKISDTDSGHETFILGKLVRNEASWDFVAVGEADAEELGGLATRYGLQAVA